MRRAPQVILATALIVFIAFACAPVQAAITAPQPATQPASTVLSLTANEPVIDRESGGPLLVREIFRQAVLLAARDQLYVPSRDHTQTRVRLAEYSMDRDDYAQAVPVAEAASQSGAQWARPCAARAREGIKDWTRAEQWIKENVEHYGVLDEWLKWCLRTGHGDLPGAQKMARQHLRVLAGRTDPQSLSDIAGVYLMLDEPERAIAPLRQMLASSGDPRAALHLALIADETGDGKARDAALTEVAQDVRGPQGSQRSRGPRGSLAALAGLFADARAKGPGSKMDPRAIDKIEPGAGPIDRCDLDDFAGRFCERCGQTDDTTRSYTRSAVGPDSNRLELIFAAVKLRARGIEAVTLPRPTSPSREEP
jgi:hypothetical protein